MKISEVLHGSLSGLLQKTQESVDGVREHPEARPVEQEAGTHSIEAKKHGEGGQSKVNLPENFQRVVGLSAREKAFFQEIFPRARKEVQAYLEQLEIQNLEKGQMVDVKG